jgi:hypothetical protein
VLFIIYCHWIRLLLDNELIGWVRVEQRSTATDLIKIFFVIGVTVILFEL